ncbi:MAG: MFS transporter [Gemmatales bacterium]
MNLSRLALPVIVLAEVLGTSLWFCGTAALDELTPLWSLDASQRGGLLTAVQLGFIAGTLFLSMTGLADAFPASRVFAASALVGVIANLGFAWLSGNVTHALFWRAATGLALAGIYPLGMKLIVTWVPDRTGEALGWLVGSVSLGTSLPFLLRALGGLGHWQIVVSFASLFTLLAGILVLILGDGPAARPPIRRFDPRAAMRSFRNPTFRASALGYFGHMWELYAFWSVVPFLVSWITSDQQARAWWTFAIIASGAVGNVVGGWMSRRLGSGFVAVLALAISGSMCLLGPLMPSLPVVLVIILLVLWGLTAPADSPQFSALSAKACAPEAVGSSLALQNAIGFSVTVLSIQLTANLVDSWSSWISWLWLPGPILGVWWMRRLFRSMIVGS